MYGSPGTGFVSDIEERQKTRPVLKRGKKGVQFRLLSTAIAGDNARVAQLAERSIRNAEVVGSTPSEGFRKSLYFKDLYFFLIHQVFGIR